MNFYSDAATGKQYSTRHLNPHSVEYVQNSVKGQPERRYNVRISYSNHCYTRSCLDDSRVFDFERYEQSKSLPRIMAELMIRECHHTGKTNFVTFDIDEKRTYEIYFKVSKKTEGLHILVQSAYIRDSARLDSRPGRAKVKFSTILFNVLHDKPIHPPQQKKR